MSELIVTKHAVMRWAERVCGTGSLRDMFDAVYCAACRAIREGIKAVEKGKNKAFRFWAVDPLSSIRFLIQRNSEELVVVTCMPGEWR